VALNKFRSIHGCALTLTHRIVVTGHIVGLVYNYRNSIFGRKQVFLHYYIRNFSLYRMV